MTRNEKTRVWCLLLLAALSASAVTLAGEKMAESAEEKAAAPAGEKTAKPAEKLDAKAYTKAVDRAIHWLRRQRHENGSFGWDPVTRRPTGQVGVTALALYALATCHGGSFGTGYAEEDTPLVTGPAEFLLKHQQESGAINVPGHGADSSCTALAVLALATLDHNRVNKPIKDPQRDAPRYAEVIAKAVEFLKRCQVKEPESLHDGGAAPGVGQAEADASTTALFVEALAKAGLGTEAPEMQRALGFLRRCLDDSGLNKTSWAVAWENSGGVRDKPDGSGDLQDAVTTPEGKKQWRATGAATYAAYVAFLRCGLPPAAPEAQALERWIKNNYTVAEDPGLGGAGRFRYFYQMARALRARGEATGRWMVTDKEGKAHCWQKELGDQILSLEVREGGSWRNENDRWGESDAVLCTSYAALALGEVARASETEKEKAK